MFCQATWLKAEKRAWTHKKCWWGENSVNTSRLEDFCGVKTSVGLWEEAACTAGRSIGTTAVRQRNVNLS